MILQVTGVAESNGLVDTDDMQHYSLTATSAISQGPAGPAGANFRGEFVLGGTYAVHDFVTVGACSYICIVAISPTISYPNTDTASWGLFATGMRFVGSWVANTQYFVGDVVYDALQTSAWVANVDSQNSLHPGATAWSQVASDGGAGLGFLWQGAWSGSGNYNLNDITTDSNALYICIVPQNAGVGSSPSTYPSHWSLYLPAGTNGSNGLGFSYAGAWSNVTSYFDDGVTSEVVRYTDNALYVTQLGIGSIPTGTLPTNATYWLLYLPAGATGAAGSNANLVDATTTSIGSVRIDANPVSGDPIAATKPTTDAIAANVATNTSNIASNTTAIGTKLNSSDTSVTNSRIGLIPFGTIGSRPVSADSGSLYFATDSNGGTLYQYQTSAWVQLKFSRTDFANIFTQPQTINYATVTTVGNRLFNVKQANTEFFSVDDNANIRTRNNTVNAGSLSAIVGGSGNEIGTVSDIGSISSSTDAIAGGSSNSIDGGATDGFIGGGNTNTVQGTNASAIIGGFQNTVNGSNSYGTIVGGSQNQISTGNSNSGQSIIGGSSNINNGNNSAIFAGQSNKIDTQRGTTALMNIGAVMGLGGSAWLPGSFVIANNISGLAASLSQLILGVGEVRTNGTTAGKIAYDAIDGSGSTGFGMAANSSMRIEVTLNAINSLATKFASWIGVARITRAATSTVTLTTITALTADGTNSTGWTAAYSVASNLFQITCTGATGDSVHWTASIRIIETGV